jgi:hypothetical protein
MLNLRKTTWGLIVAANLFAATSVQAQSSPDFPGFYQPFSEITFDNYDYQWFAPRITEEYGSDFIEPNTGIFLEYHRLQMNVGRGNQAPGHYDGDKAWGNRVDLGWMSTEDHGWLASVWNLDGPTFDQRNRGNFNSVELNKTWRFQINDHGAHFEPMAGLRYTKFEDKTDILVFMENNMLTGQLGGRLFSRRGQWLLHGEAKALAGHNWAFRGDFNSVESVVVGGEFKLGASYYLTRDVALDVSWNTLYYGTGIARDPDPLAPRDKQSLFISGVAFGVTLRR